jgi:response regulator of citrate/malate metabolism
MKNKLNCILVIDDDEPTNFISTMLIEEADCTSHLEIADSGIKALNYLKKASEFLKEFEKIKNDYPQKPVIIMLTTSLNPDDKIRAESIPDIAGFENKPLTKELIERVMKNYFNKSQVS